MVVVILRSEPEAAVTPWCEENLVNEGLQPMDNSQPVHWNRTEIDIQKCFTTSYIFCSISKSKV
jgi:hypothetical protein